VHPEFEYIKIKDGETGAIWILLEKCLNSIYKDPKTAKFTVLEKIKGSSLKGISYIPLFDYFADVITFPYRSVKQLRSKLLLTLMSLMIVVLV
jgi:isoleucyl-tRNA synthetase